MDLEDLKLSRYILDAGAKGLSVGGIDANSIALGWRIQRQFDTDQRVADDDKMNNEAQSYLVGCQVMNLLNMLKPYHNQKILLLFDIFANGLVGADADLGPSSAVRKEIVKHFKDKFSFILVMEALRKSRGEGIFKASLITEYIYIQPKGIAYYNCNITILHQTIDSNHYSLGDKGTFMSFLDISMGAQMKTFIHAGETI